MTTANKVQPITFITQTGKQLQSIVITPGISPSTQFVVDSSAPTSHLAPSCASPNNSLLCCEQNRESIGGASGGNGGDEKRIAKTIENLKQTGFQQIPGTRLFVHEEDSRLNYLVIQVNQNGSWRLFLPYHIRVSYPRGSKMCKESIIGIKADLAKRELLVLDDKDRATKCSIYGWSHPIPSWETKISRAEFVGKTIEQQLIDTGFKELTKGVYQLEFVDEGKKVPSIVMTKDGIVQRMLYPADDHFESKIKGMQIIEGWPLLTLGDEAKKYNISSSSRHGHGAKIVGGRFLREHTAEELGVVPVKSEPSGFKIGGVNSTELIGSLTSINGISVDNLEKQMRPKKLSYQGFLGPDESLLEIMAEDNEFVLSRGLTHQDLALPLRQAVKYAKAAHNKGFDYRFTYHGRRYLLDVLVLPGGQLSPFNDDTYADCEIMLTNLDNMHTIEFSELHPEMIERYGFYEGRGTRYRLEPADILKVFDFLWTTPPASILLQDKKYDPIIKALDRMWSRLGFARRAMAAIIYFFTPKKLYHAREFHLTDLLKETLYSKGPEQDQLISIVKQIRKTYYAKYTDEEFSEFLRHYCNIDYHSRAEIMAAIK